MFQHLLVPTDGSELSCTTAQRAVKFAKNVGAKITAFYARPTVNTEQYGNLVEPDALEEAASGSMNLAKEYLGFIKKLCKEAGVKFHAVSVVSDSPWEAIVNAAEDNGCDLIFMSKQSQGLKSMLMGSETTRVLNHSNIPVLVYRPPEVGAKRREKKARDKAKKVHKE
jgi:nucleotide-binding universal stress UspA family protein